MLRTLLCASKRHKSSNTLHYCTRNISITQGKKMSLGFIKDPDSERRFVLPRRFQGSEESLWVEYAHLASFYDTVNLGQGFTDYAPPKHVQTALSNVASQHDTSVHQYTRGFGHNRLVVALSKLYSKLLGYKLNPLEEIIITIGAYEALYTTITGHIDDGDEVIIIEPFFDCYEPMVRYAGGIPRFIPLRKIKNGCKRPFSGEWVLDKEELEGLFNEKTKAIILNNPNNPMGKVYELEELQVIADLCKKWNVLCISDEVYEFIVYPPFKHHRIVQLPDMWSRTITIGSAGKALSVTGWKLGWAYGPKHLIDNLKIIHQNSIYTGVTPVQEAVAICLETEYRRFDKPNSYLKSLAEELKPKREYMLKFLKDAGMKPIIPQGGYFIMADWTALESKVDLDSESDKYKDYRFTKWMIKKLHLQGIPPTAFYSEPHKSMAENYVRYCFFKDDGTLKTAAKILERWEVDTYSASE